MNVGPTAVFLFVITILGGVTAATLYYERWTTVLKRILLATSARKTSISSFGQQTVNIYEFLVEANYRQVHPMKVSLNQYISK